MLVQLEMGKIDEFKNSKAEAEMKAAGEKIMKESGERELASKPKPLPMGTKVKYNYQNVKKLKKKKIKKYLVKLNFYTIFV